MKKKAFLFKISNIRTIILSVLIVHIGLVNLGSHILNYMRIQLYLELFVAFIYLRQISKLKRFKNQTFVIGIFCMMIMVSSFFNKNKYDGANIETSLVFALAIIELYLYAQLLVVTQRVVLGVKMVWFCVLFYCGLNDILILINPSDFAASTKMGYLSSTFNNFLLGNKFLVSYLHVFAIVFYIYLCERRKRVSYIKIAILFAWSISISLYVECTTAFIGQLILILMILFKEKITEIIRKTKSVLITLAVSDSFFLFNATLLQIPFIQNIITNILHEDVGLTGRISAYAHAFLLISGSPIIGYGYDNNYSVSRLILNIDNVQNGLLDYVVSFGVVGTILFLIILIMNIRRLPKCCNPAFLFLVYVFIILSSVEVTLTLKFHVALAFLSIEWLEYQYLRK